tara:strand:+ start:429 stop:698 length:270 start_codon:yes stop_codon:yes gene_type:complete
MKKGYHDYVPVIKKKDKKQKKETTNLSKEKYITTAGGFKHMICDAKGNVVAGNDVLVFGHKFPTAYTSSRPSTSCKISTKDYIKYNTKY